MTISSYGLSLILAIIACVIGGVLGGLTLARPGSASGLATQGDDDAEGEGALPTAVPLTDGKTQPRFELKSDGRTEGRALGGLLILSHAATALFLGYQSNVGAAMAFALAMAWMGAALGRAVSALLDRPRARLNLSRLAFELMLAATLALPFFNPGRLVILRGHGMLV